MTDRALQLLRPDPRLAELVAFPFNFDLDRADQVEDVRPASGGSQQGQRATHAVNGAEGARSGTKPWARRARSAAP